MTTRLDLRVSLRERLEDTGNAPLWSDAALNEWLGQAVRQYGVQLPRQAIAATDPVPAGAVEITLPEEAAAGSVVAVRNAAGATVPRGDDRVADTAPLQRPGAAQGWHAWGSELRLQRAAAGADELGPWSIDYLGGRELIGNDVDPQPIEPGDEPAIVAMAAAMALERRALESGKRGDTVAAREMRAIAGSARDEAATLLARRQRRPRSGFLQMDGAV